MLSSQRTVTVLAACVFVSATALHSSASAQALRVDTELAAAAVQSAVAACLQALDQPMIDPALLIRRCTTYIDSEKVSPGEAGAAHLVRAAAYRDLGDEPHARADDQEAIRLYTSVIDTYEPYPEFVFRRATAYHSLGDIKSALRDYDTAIRGNPWNVVAFADRGLLLLRHHNQYNLAAADFDQALKLAPDNVKILILRGDTYAAQGKYTLALADLDRAVALTPRDPEVYTHRASAYGRKGATDAALKDYEQALSIDKDNFDALLSRAALYAEAGNGAAAVADTNRALAVRPGNPAALYNRGYARFVERKYEAAIADYSAAIDSAPDFGMAYTNRCLNAALAGKDKVRTLADCDHAIRLIPARADVRETRGFVGLKYGDNQAALADYEAALKTDANRPLSLYGRGIARLRTGDTEAGNADKEAARALYPNVGREFAPYGVE
jgi:tetratricopeptide (TPR) repeat protein